MTSLPFVHQKPIVSVLPDLGNILLNYQHDRQKIYYTKDGMSIKIRLLEFIDSMETNPKTFEVTAGLGNGFVNNAGDSVRRVSLEKISKAYPELNTAWLLTGEGDMFKTSKTVAEPRAKYEKQNITGLRIQADPLYIAADPNDFDNDGSKFEDLGNGMLRFRFPVIPIKAQAGYLRGYQDPEYYDGFKTEYLEVYKEYKGHYLAFEVKGDSMTPTDPALFPYMALNGWIAVGREVARHHWQYKLHTHNTDAWIIAHNTEGILIKSIVQHDVEKRNITIHSLNPEYEDEVLNLDDIAQIFAVQKYIVNAR